MSSNHSLCVRIIPCLDIKNGRVVKGVKFVDLIDAGDPIECAVAYENNFADELCFLDITASNEKREILIHLVENIANKLFIPFTVGGGLSSLTDIKAVLTKGADKVSINTAAFQNPDLLKQSSEIFGSQCIVCAIDVKYHEGRKRHEVFLHGGRTETGRDALDWGMEAVHNGAGEILLTSMDRDGTKNGFDICILKTFSANLEVPIIASGGAGCPEHMVEAVLRGKADAVLAASIFHFGEFTIEETKKEMKKMGINVRL